jgi:hypothetical protein
MELQSRGMPHSLPAGKIGVIGIIGRQGWQTLPILPVLPAAARAPPERIARSMAADDPAIAPFVVSPRISPYLL